MEKLSTKEILRKNLSRSAPDGMENCKIILHDVRSMHNIGAAFRNADAFGIDELILSGFSPTPPRPEISKTAIGAEEFVQWRQSNDIRRTLLELKENNYTILGLEQTTDSVLLPDFELSIDKKICLLFGNEVTGIDGEILPLVDRFLEIPQFGHKHSLNVSVTVGVALYAFLEKFWKTPT